ncbi:hypothetical protein [Flavobacterium sp. FlaQc-28]|uniref:hypothetical protein n=1 Tax=Flavobacterium sp. FlaQc-28 TaxID=3374178 RepID=UPI0037574AC3
MNEIYNAIKNAVDYHIKEYNKKNLFDLSLSNSLAKEFAVKYSGMYKTVDFSIEVKYIDNDIKFSTYIDASNSTEASFEITDFIRWIVQMPKEDLIKRIQFALRQ